MSASSAHRQDSEDCARRSRASQSNRIPHAGLIEDIRAATRRLQALSRRLAALDLRRVAAARELNDEVEQTLVGLDLLERDPPSASLAASVADLRRTARDIQKTLRRRR